MSKHDYAKLRAEFLEAQKTTDLSLSKWCESKGLNYNTTRKKFNQVSDGEKPQPKPKPAAKPKKPKAQSLAKKIEQAVKETEGTVEIQADQSVLHKADHSSDPLEQIIDLIDSEPALSDKQRKALSLYANNLSVESCYQKAGYADPRSFYELLSKPQVDHIVKLIRMRHFQRTEENAASLYEFLIQVLYYDTNRIRYVYKAPCRFCNGIGHRYQWINELEFEFAYEKWHRKNAHLAEDKQDPEPDDRGGYGYDKEGAKPHKGCPNPKCGGRGIPELWICDMRDLDPIGRLLIHSIKQAPSGGIEIVLIDVMKLINMLATFIDKRSALHLEYQRMSIEHERSAEIRKEEAHEMTMREKVVAIAAHKARIKTMMRANGTGNVKIKLVNAFVPLMAVPEGVKEGDPLTDEEAKNLEIRLKANDDIEGLGTLDA